MENKKINSFKDLLVWQKAASLAVLVYSITENFPNSELYGLTNQIRRSAVSISSNIAEGFKRNHKKEKLQFYNIAYGSVAELESQIEISLKLNFLKVEEYKKITDVVIEISKMIDGLIKSTNKSINSFILNPVFFFVFLYSIFYILNPTIVFGADFYIESDASHQGGALKIYLDTKGESINTISGKLIFDEDILEVEKVSDGNSAVNFWIEKPKIIEDGEIAFSGITTGGMVGKKNLIFELVVRTKAERESIITFENLVVLKNDGLGTSVSTTKKDFIFDPLSYRNEKVQSKTDFTKPESFKPKVTRDPNIFDGKFFVVFATQDKGSGISHYEVKEGFWGRYKRVESPYELKNQLFIGDIFVKAVDNEGNYIIEKSEFTKWTLRYQNNLLFSIICLYILFFFCKKILCKKIYSKIFQRKL